VGKRYGSGLQRLQTATATSMIQDATFEDEFYSYDDTYDSTARYVRAGVLVVLSIVLALVMIVMALISAFPH
jgi:hypothetical protein